ncbi:bifunctional DNA primase/polymerase [Rathayibacter sp. AY1H2]|uniref:bifunctional DNA primase/polymerase n=1 Tax=Rathayibacter sp. AY1H2 TaxID=2080566 RepID=UPI0015E379DC|nr:bifunctional DNA primase/polymerase [Rathayibacter sp. AY1H2]
MSVSLVKHALRAAGAGFSVFPLRALSKRPQLERWQKRSTTDTTTIEAWWSKWPDANVAIDTGKSGILVIDLDVDSEGSLEPALAEWKAVAGDFIPSVVATTPSGGRHFYLRDPGSGLRNTVKVVGAHLDVRAEGGYVVAPGSVLPSGVYRWV